jgi:hypothetical protein
LAPGEERSGSPSVTRLLMLVEGQSEEIFVKRTLTPARRAGNDREPPVAP